MATPAPVDPSFLQAPPSPTQAPGLHDSVTLGSWRFPPVPGEGGTAKLKLKSVLKVDKQKASGKDKAKTKINGRDPLEGELVITWTEPIYEAAVQFTMAIDPNGPNAGVPLDVTCPEAQRRHLAQIIVEEAGELDDSQVGRWKQSYKVCEWVDPGTADKPGATSTPDDEDEDANVGKYSPDYGGKTRGGATPSHSRDGVDVSVPADPNRNNAWGGAHAPSADP